MNTSRNAPFYASLALALAGCTTGQTRPTTENADVRTAISDAFQVAQVTTGTNAEFARYAAARTPGQQAPRAYNALARIGENPDGRAVRDALAASVSEEFARVITGLVNQSTKAPTNTVRTLVGEYLRPNLVAGFEKADGSEMLVDLLGNQTAKLTFAGGVLTAYSLVADAPAPTMGYFNMQGQLASGAKSLVYGNDSSTGISAIGSGAYIETARDPRTLELNSLEARALGAELTRQFNISSRGPFVLNQGTVRGAATVDAYAVALPDGRVIVSTTDMSSGLANATPTYVRAHENDRVRLVSYGTAANNQLVAAGMVNNPQKDVPTTSLGQLYRAAREVAGTSGTLEISNVQGRTESVTPEQLVSRLVARGFRAEEHGTPHTLDAMGVVLDGSDLVGKLLESGAVTGRQGNVIRQFYAPGVLTNVHNGFQYRTTQE